MFGNFPVCPVLLDSVIRHLQSTKANGYVHSAGTEISRKAIAGAYSLPGFPPLTVDDVVVASGCSGALDISLSALLEEGDNILLPRPGFPLYETIALTRKVEPRHYSLIPSKNWECDLEEMEKLIDSKTKAILVNNPSNPCGSVYSKDHLNQIIELAEKYKIVIIADEIYGNLTFKGYDFIPLASLSSTVPVISVGGIAKEHLVPGWRVGWAIVYDRSGLLRDVKEGMIRLTQLILGCNTPIMAALPDILTPVKGSKEEDTLRQFRKDTIEQLEGNAKLTLEMLSAVQGLQVVTPQGAMYVMVHIQVSHFKDITSDVDFAQHLLTEEGVFVLPSSCFGIKDYFRIVFTAPSHKLKEAYERIGSFCLRHRK